MDAHNVLIAAPNLADKATLSGGNWAAPLTNLQTRDLKRVARSISADPSATWGDVDLARESTIKALGLVDHNCTVAAKIRWRAYDDQARTSVRWDSGYQDVWPSALSTSVMQWTDINWFSGKPSQADADVWECPVWSQILAASMPAKYWRWQILDPSNAAGHIDIGRLVMASGAQPECNMSFGVTLGYQDTSVIDELEDGRERCELRPLRKVATFTFEHLSQDEAYSLALELQRKLGTWGEMLVCLDPTNTKLLQQNTIWGRFRQLQPIVRPEVIRYTAPFDIIQIVR